MQVHPERAQRATEPEGDNHAAGPSRGRGRGRGRGGATRGASGASQGIPGSIPTGSISKLKAQLRQTKRLLARDDLTPDVRTTSERRLQTLEMELEKASTEASTGQLEKKMVTKYRGLRFFERQKILRKIKQTKKALAALPDDPALTQNLLESRIDLYYVLHYPKTSKYIALFPDGTYVPHTPSPLTTTTNSKDAAASRAKLRDDIRLKIEHGKLAPEPEVGDLGIEGEEDVGSGPAGEEGEERKRGAEEEGGERAAKKARVEVVVPSPPSPPLPAVVEVVKKAEKKVVVASGPVDPKKAKKDAKDAKRREKKEAEARALAGEVEVEAPKAGTAFDDDFFE